MTRYQRWHQKFQISPSFLDKFFGWEPYGSKKPRKNTRCSSHVQNRCGLPLNTRKFYVTCNFTQLLQFLDLFFFLKHGILAPVNSSRLHWHQPLVELSQTWASFWMRFGHPKSSRPKSAGGLLLGPPRRRGNQMWLKGLASENDTIRGGQPFVAHWKKSARLRKFQTTPKKMIRQSHGGGWFRIFLFDWMIFGFHLHFPGCNTERFKISGSFFQKDQPRKCLSATAAWIGTPWKQSLFTLTWSTQNT